MQTRTLSEREQRVLDLLQAPTGLSVKAIADQVGISRRTVWEIRQRPHFIAAMEDHKNEEALRWKTQLRALVPRAITHLTDAINGRPSTHSVKAALSIMQAVGLAEKPEPTLASRVQGTVTIDFGLPKEMIEDPISPQQAQQLPQMPQITATVAAQTVVVQK